MTPNNFRVKSGLTVGTTISGGNTTIAGFANVDGNITSRNLLLQGDNTNAYIRPSNSPSNLYLGANGANYLTIFSNGNFNVGSSLTVTAAASFLSSIAANNTVTIRGLSGEGGQLVFGYGNNLATTISGQANNTFNLDVVGGDANNTPVMRLFTVNNDGTATNIYAIANTGRIHFGSGAAQTDSTVKVTGSANVTTTLQVGGVATFAANVAMVNNNITRPVLTGYTEHEVANAAVTGTFTMDCGAANFFDLTLTGNTTISPSNVPPSTRVWSGSIAAKQDATGGRTITWPAGTKYAGGVAPPATTTANALDIWSLMTYDGGTSWIVSLSVKGVA